MTIPFRIQPAILYTSARQTASARDSRIELWCIAILSAIIFEGALRKWVLPPSIQTGAYAAKDFIAVLFVLRHPLRRSSTHLKKLRTVTLDCSFLLLPSLIVGFLQSPAGALMTLTNALFWPIFAFHLADYVVPRVIEKLTQKLAIVSIAMSVLACAQYALPPTHFLNSYAWNAMGIDFDAALMADRVRATGTFSYLTGLASFGAFGFSWFVWQLLSQRFKDKSQVLILLGAFSALLCILTSGSRAPMLLCLVGLVMGMALTRSFKALICVALIGVLFVFAIPYLPPDSPLDSYIARSTTAQDSFESRAIDPLTWFVGQLEEDPMGDGLGMHSQLATLDSSKTIGYATMSSHEDARARIASEAGFLGIGYFFAVVLIVLQCFLVCSRKGDSRMRAATGVIGSILILVVFNGLWYDHVASALWWFAAGVWLSIWQPRGRGLPVVGSPYRVMAQ